MEAGKTYWKETNKDLGSISEGSKHRVVFLAKPDIPAILDIIPDCGCTSVKFSHVLKELIVTFNATMIKNREVSSTSVNKKIVIYYQNREEEILTIQATKKRK
jgi:hypothetical protein